MNDLQNVLERLTEKTEEIRRFSPNSEDIEVLREHTYAAHGIIGSAFHGNDDSRYYRIFDKATEDLLGNDLKAEQNPKSYKLLLLSFLNNYIAEMRSELKK